MHRTCTAGDCCNEHEQPCHKEQPSHLAHDNQKQSWECAKTKSCSSSKSKSATAKYFEVTLVDKELHPQADRIPQGKKALAVNGYAGPRINLTRGNCYKFRFEQPLVDGVEPQVLYFTRDIIGGAECLGLENGKQLPGTSSVSNGVITLRIDSETPSSFYYQLQGTPFAGGLIVVRPQESC
jgi:hypothetical protein